MKAPLIVLGSLGVGVLAAAGLSLAQSESIRRRTWLVNSKVEVTEQFRPTLRYKTFLSSSSAGRVVACFYDVRADDDLNWSHLEGDNICFAFNFNTKQALKVGGSSRLFVRDEVVLESEDINGWAMHIGIVGFDPKLEWSDRQIEANIDPKRRIRLTLPK